MFVKGKSGNPSGRVSEGRKQFVRGLVKSGLANKALAVLEEELTKNKKNRTQVAMYILDQAYGKPKQAIEHTGEEGGPLIIKVTYA